MSDAKDYDTQALEGAAKYFENLATMGDPAPLAFAQAIRRTLNATKWSDSDTLYFVGSLTRIANASQREDGTDIPLGEILRAACKHMEKQADEIGRMTEKMWADRDDEFQRGWKAAKDAMTPASPWSDRQ